MTGERNLWAAYVCSHSTLKESVLIRPKDVISSCWAARSCRLICSRVCAVAWQALISPDPIEHIIFRYVTRNGKCCCSHFYISKRHKCCVSMGRRVGLIHREQPFWLSDPLPAPRSPNVGRWSLFTSLYVCAAPCSSTQSFHYTTYLQIRRKL